MKKALLGVVVFSISVLAIFSLQGMAMAFPTRPIELVVGYSAGGGTHLAAELLVPDAEKFLKQPIRVSTRPGAGGAIGATYVARSRPDGYTLLYATLSLVAGPYLDVAEYELKDFVGVAQCSDIAPVMVVKGDSPINNAKELVEMAKKNPGSLTWGHPGIGSSLHLLGANALFRMDIIDDMIDVPFRGTAQSLAAVMGGHITAVSTFYPAVAENVIAGDLKVIGVSGTERIPEIPDVPTFVEQGYPSLITSWRGVFAPKDTPPERLAFLRQAFGEIIATEEYRDRAVRLGEPPAYKTGEDFTKMMFEQDEMLAVLIKELGLGVDQK